MPQPVVRVRPQRLLANNFALSQKQPGHTRAVAPGARAGAQETAGTGRVVPDYRDGRAPFGIWTPARMLVAPLWISSSDPNLDIGLLVLNPLHGGHPAGPKR